MSAVTSVNALCTDVQNINFHTVQKLGQSMIKTEACPGDQ